MGDSFPVQQFLEFSKRKRTSFATTTAATKWMQQCKDLLDMVKQTVDDASSSLTLCSIPRKRNCHQGNLQMDLLKVSDKLRIGKYVTHMDFANDVRFLFENSKNCCTGKESPIFSLMLRVSAVFEEHYSKFLASLRSPENSEREAMNASARKATSRKCKSLTLPSSTNDTTGGVDNSEETVKTATKLDFTLQATGHAQPCVPKRSVIPTEDCVVNHVAKITKAFSAESIDADVPQENACLQAEAPLLNEKDQVNFDIENGFRNLVLIEAELKKDLRLLSEQQKNIDSQYAKLLQCREPTDRPDCESHSRILQLTCFTELRDQIHCQLRRCYKDKLTRKLMWRERQACSLKLELELELLDPTENALEFETKSKMLTEERNQEKQSENGVKSIRDEIMSLEREQEDVDRKISNLKAMHETLAEMIALKSATETWISMTKSKKNDIVRDLGISISAWKAREMKLIETVCQEAVGNLKKVANERYKELGKYVICEQNVDSASSN